MKSREETTQTKLLQVIYMTACRQFLCLLATPPFTLHPEVWVVFRNQIVVLCL